MIYGLRTVVEGVLRASVSLIIRVVAIGFGILLRAVFGNVVRHSLRLALRGLCRERSRSCADKFDENYVRADFDYPVPGDKDVVRGRYTLEKTFFAGHDEAHNSATVIENHVADVSEFSAVGDVYDGLA